jgi:alanine racemase
MPARLMDPPPAQHENPHGALLSVDLAALQSNWRLLNHRSGMAECGAVVKADAYGLGIEPAVRALAAAGCRTFFVAHLAEGCRARAAAPQADIYVLNGLPPDAARAYATARLRPVLGSLDDIEMWNAAGGGPCAVHADTGMNRLGLPPDDVAQAAGAAIDVALVMTHLVASEVPDDPLNARQIKAFRERVVPLFATSGARFSLMNSSAHFLPGCPALDLTRPGYALYGGNPTPGLPNPMRDVVRLEAPIVQVRRIHAGDTVGYNGTWTAGRDSLIATISVGYADGWPRALSATDACPGGFGAIGGVRVPFAGRVSMDLITLDVTDVPQPVRPGDRVVLLGDGIGVDDVAAAAGTNGYEVLTQLGRRYRRTVHGA